MIKLHLGCGKNKLPGFIHVDLADYPHIDYKHDIRSLPMFEDGSATLIYCCHALEYFDRLDAYMALKEWHRILEGGGILRLAVPDFEEIVKLYFKYKREGVYNPLEQIGILGPLYGRMQVNKDIIYHKTVYDFESLKNLLLMAGFKKIHRYDWHKTLHKDFDDCSQSYIPHMDKKNGVLLSLNVEATK